MPLIISKNGKAAEKIDRSNFRDEDYLQNYIHDNPGSIPLYEIDDDIKLLILAREFSTESGPIDAIGIDQNGGIYIVETKLYKNPDKRLVVAQVLDYGASLAFTKDSGGFIQQLENKVQKHFNTNLRNKIQEYFDLLEEETEQVINKLEVNLETNQFRFVVLMDKLENRLKDLIIFLNQSCSFDIYGVELDYYKYQDFEILIPKLFGAEIKKEVKTIQNSGNRRKWNEESFFMHLKENIKPEEYDLLSEFYEFLKTNAAKINWGTGSINGSFNPIFNNIAQRSILTINTLGTISFNYGWMDATELEKKYQKRYKTLLEEVFELPIDDGSPKLPSFTITDWINKVNSLKEIVLKLIKA